MALQLELFDEENIENLEQLKKDIQETRQSSEKVRRGLFARHNELAKMYVELNQRLGVLEKNICNSSIKQS